MEQPKNYYYQKAMRYATYYLACTCIRALTRDPMMIILYILLLLAFVGLSKRRYFPFVSKLEICEDAVVKTRFGHAVISIERKDMTVHQFKIYKTVSAIFTAEKSDSISLVRAARLQKMGLAIMYPYQAEMGKDFPEVFESFV